MSAKRSFILTIITFGVILVDLVVTLFDKLFWGDQYADIIVESPWNLLFTHMIVTVILWGIGIVYIVKYIKKNSNEVIDFKLKQKWKFYIGAFLLGVLFMIIEMIFYKEATPQFLREYSVFEHYYGSKAIYLSIMQNIYYLAESVLVVLLLSLSHYTFEKWFKNTKIPYAGIFLGLTWGVVHFIKGPLVGLVVTLGAVLIGHIYIVSGRKWIPGILFVWLIFFL